MASKSATKKVGSSRSSATTLCPSSSCTWPIVGCCCNACCTFLQTWALTIRRAAVPPLFRRCLGHVRSQPLILEKISVPKRSWFITLPPPSMVASFLTALVQRLMTCQYTAQPLMGKLLIAFIDFMSSRVAQKNYTGLISGYKSHFWAPERKKFNFVV